MLASNKAREFLKENKQCVYIHMFLGLLGEGKPVGTPKGNVSFPHLPPGRASSASSSRVLDSSENLRLSILRLFRESKKTAHALDQRIFDSLLGEETLDNILTSTLQNHHFGKQPVALTNHQFGPNVGSHFTENVCLHC